MAFNFRIPNIMESTYTNIQGKWGIVATHSVAQVME